MSIVYCDKAKIITVPAGGVVAEHGYIINDVFWYALETKNEGKEAVGLIDDVIVPLPYSGSGEVAYELASNTTDVVVYLTIDGNWIPNGVLTLTFTIPGVSEKDIWGLFSLNGVQRQSFCSIADNTVIIYVKNTSGGTVSAGSKITRGVIYRLGDVSELLA